MSSEESASTVSPSDEVTGAQAEADGAPQADSSRASPAVSEAGSEGDPKPEAARPAAPAEPAEPADPAEPAQTAPKPKPAAAKPAPKPKPPPRQLPDFEGIAAWAQGEDYPLLGVLFENLPLAKFDGLVMQIKKAELLPQHWQVISRHQVPEGVEFNDFHAVGRLRVAYKDQELSRRRLGALEAAFEELRGKNPSLWTASDVFAAVRRILQKKRDVNVYDLLTAVRDVWGGLSIPHGKEQTEVLWAVLDFVRSKTRK